MTSGVFAAVLFAALLHASWNALVKSSGDKELDTALLHGLGAMVGVPLLLWVGLPPREAWPYVGASLVIHIGYYFALAGAYKHGDLGLTYPIMRGFTAGVALVGLSRVHGTHGHGKALLFAFSNAGIIALYTVIDGLGVRAA